MLKDKKTEDRNTERQTEIEKGCIDAHRPISIERMLKYFTLILIIFMKYKRIGIF